MPPSVKISPSEKTANETGRVDLFCNATGNPAPNLTWTVVETGNEFSRTEHLIIDSLSREHSGTYACTASNEAGNATAKVHLDVQCKYRGLHGNRAEPLLALGPTAKLHAFIGTKTSQILLSAAFNWASNVTSQQWNDLMPRALSPQLSFDQICECQKPDISRWVLCAAREAVVHIPYTGKSLDPLDCVCLQLDHNASRACNHNALRHLPS